MRSEESTANGRREPAGEQSRRSADKAVEHHGKPCSGSGKNHPGNCADLESANLAENVHRVIRIWSIVSYAAFYGGNLSFEGLIVDPGAATRNQSRSHAAQHTENGRSAARIPDPHLTGAHQKNLFVVCFIDQANTGLDRAHRLTPAHRRPMH